MRLDEFTAQADALWRALPPALKQGVTGVEIIAQPKYDAEFDDVPLLGECIPDPVAALAPEGPVWSIIALYYGSFVEVAALEPDSFDWDQELRQTLLHELRHHLDWRQGHDTLGLEDDLQRQNMLRRLGQPFALDYYQWGLRLGPRVWEVDGDGFMRVEVPRGRWHELDRGGSLTWRGWLITLVGPAPAPSAPGLLFWPALRWQRLTDAAAPAPEAWDQLVVVVRRVWWWARHPELIVRWVG